MMIYCVISFTSLFTLKIPFFYPQQLYSNYSTAPYIFIMLNALISISIIIYMIVIKLLFRKLTRDEYKNCCICFFGKLYFNIFTIYIFNGLENFNEMVVWFIILMFPSIFSNINLIILSRLKSFETNLQRSSVKHTKIIFINSFQITLNAIFIYFGYNFFYFYCGFGPFIITFFESFKCFIQQIEIFIICLLQIFRSRYNATRPNLFYYVEKYFSINSFFISIIQCMLILYFKGYDSILIIIYLINKIFVFSHKIVRLMEKTFLFYELNKNLSKNFTDASPDEIKNCDRCVICCEQIKTGKKLDCNHIFHFSCIVKWLKYKNVCPICRAVIRIREVRSRYYFGTSFFNVSYESRNGNSVLSVNTPQLGGYLPSISFEVHQIASYVPRRQRIRNNRRRQAVEGLVRDVMEVVPNTTEYAARRQLQRSNYNLVNTINNLIEN